MLVLILIHTVDTDGIPIIFLKKFKRKNKLIKKSHQKSMQNYGAWKELKEIAFSVHLLV